MGVAIVAVDDMRLESPQQGPQLTAIPICRKQVEMLGQFKHVDRRHFFLTGIVVYPPNFPVGRTAAAGELDLRPALLLGPGQIHSRLGNFGPLPVAQQV